MLSTLTESDVLFGFLQRMLGNSLGATALLQDSLEMGTNIYVLGIVLREGLEALTSISHMMFQFG